MNIAVILTCFNRREKTQESLRHLYAARDYCNSHSGEDKIALAIYLTDDGCTDGTAEAVEALCKGEKLYISRSEGNLYWAKGMCLSWRKALENNEKWDYFLLLNDDTDMMEDCFKLLFDANEYCKKQWGREGIVSGITCDKTDEGKITYGGRIWTNYLLGKDMLLEPKGVPQRCDKANSNIMLVSKEVVDEIGIFFDGFVHGVADYDYSMRAVSKGLPVVVTSKVCGKCDYDHHSEEDIKKKILSMTFAERKAYFENPLHSSADVLLLKKRNTPSRFLLGYIGRMLNLYFPKFYYGISAIRG